MIRAPAVDPFCPSAADALACLRGLAAASEPGAYVPLTRDDNAPWRFDMRQNGRQMTSVEFDAWVKARGIRVATGRAVVDGAVPPGVGLAVPTTTAGGASGDPAPSGGQR